MEQKLKTPPQTNISDQPTSDTQTNTDSEPKSSESRNNDILDSHRNMLQNPSNNIISQLDQNNNNKLHFSDNEYTNTEYSKPWEYFSQYQQYHINVNNQKNQSSQQNNEQNICISPKNEQQNGKYKDKKKIPDLDLTIDNIPQQSHQPLSNVVQEKIKKYFLVSLLLLVILYMLFYKS